MSGAAKVHELRARASIATLNAKIDAPAKRILELRKQMAEAAAEMDRAILESHEATEELIKLGETATPLPTYHLLTPFIRHTITETPARARELLWLLAEGRHGPVQNAAIYAFNPVITKRIGETVQAVLVPKNDLLGRIVNARIWEATPEVHEQVVEDLHAIFDGGFEARDELHARRERRRSR